MIEWQTLLYSSIFVVGMCEWIKKYDKEDKFKPAYKYLPVVLAAAAAALLFFAGGEEAGVWIGVFNGLLIFSTSTLTYDTLIETITRKFKSM